MSQKCEHEDVSFIVTERWEYPITRTYTEGDKTYAVVNYSDGEIWDSEHGVFQCDSCHEAIEGIEVE